MYGSRSRTQLHQTAVAKGRQYPSVSNLAFREGRGNAAMALPGTHTGEETVPSVAIDADPLSSEGEEQRMNETSTDSMDDYKGIRSDVTRHIGQRSYQVEKLAGVGNKSKSEKRNAGQSRRSQRKKLQDDPVNLSLMWDLAADKHNDEQGAKQGADVSDDEAAILSWQQPSPKKRKVGVYHGAAAGSGAIARTGLLNIHANSTQASGNGSFQAVPELPTPAQNGRQIKVSRFKAPDDDQFDNRAIPRTAPSFVMPEGATPPTRRSTNRKIHNEKDSFRFPDSSPSPGSALKVTTAHEVPSASASSSEMTTTTDLASVVFSHPDSPTLSHRRPSSPRSRRGSTSSLSSVNSIASLLLTQEEKYNLMTDDAEANGADPLMAIQQANKKAAQCPFCNAAVQSIHLEEFTVRHCRPGSRGLLPSRLQQRFCRDHRAIEARETWAVRGYPNISWKQLATTRVDRHLPTIEAILRSGGRDETKKASYYRTKLVEAISDNNLEARKTARSRRTTIARSSLLSYLKEDILDIVKPGYYGPRGAKVAAEAITLRLSTALAEVAETDSLVRRCGASGFVQAVLAPELIMRWVREDGVVKVGNADVRADGEVGTKEGEAIRKVLEESNEIGALVNDDDDDGDDDDDDDGNGQDGDAAGR